MTLPAVMRRHLTILLTFTLILTFACVTLTDAEVAVDGDDKDRSSVDDVNDDPSDANDNTPVFSQSRYTFQIHENTEIGTVVGIVQAYDNDTGINGEFDFYIADSMSDGTPLPFNVMENGTIKVSDLLDRESISNYIFFVQVRDRGQPTRSNRVLVFVNILDENDNAPVILFPFETNSIVLREIPDDGSYLMAVIAYDEDEDEAARLIYSIYSGNEDMAFSIVPTTGDIMIADGTRLQNHHEYRLLVKVEDSTPHPKFAMTEIRVEINLE